MLSSESFPCLKKSSSNDNLIQKPFVLKYSDVLKQKNTNINNSLKFSEAVEKESKNDTKTDLLIKTISEKTEKLAVDNSKSPIESHTKPHTEKNTNKDKNNINSNELQNKYEDNLDKIVKIQAWWRMVSKIKALKNIEKNKINIKDDKKKENEKKEETPKKTLPKKPSFSDIVKLAPPAPTTQPEKTSSNSTKKPIKAKKNGKNANANENSNDKDATNEKKNTVKSKKENEEINSILKNMKFMGLIEKEIDDLTEKNTIVNGKQFAKTKVVTIKKFSRTNSSSSSFSVDDVIEKDTKKKGGKNENKSNNKKRVTKNVSFNEKDEVFNEYNHVMKKLDLHLRCDKKSCLIDCYRRLYKRDWEEDVSVSEESSSSGISETEENIESTTPIKKSDYLYNDIYNPNYTKYYSGSDYDFGNRYFTGKERLKKALHLEPVEVTVQKIIYQPMKFQKNNRRNNQQKKKNTNKRKQK